MKDTSNNQISRRALNAIETLYFARKNARIAKSMLIEIASNVGQCKDAESENKVPCYHRNIPKESWCDVCKQKLPLWEDYHKKANAAGTALRSVLNIGKDIANGINAEIKDGAIARLSNEHSPNT